MNKFYPVAIALRQKYLSGDDSNEVKEIKRDFLKQLTAVVFDNGGDLPTEFQIDLPYGKPFFYGDQTASEILTEVICNVLVEITDTHCSVEIHSVKPSHFLIFINES